MGPGRYGLSSIEAAMLGVGLLRPMRRTDADRLRDLDAAEARHYARLSAPKVIAAQSKRVRRQQRNLSIARAGGK